MVSQARSSMKTLSAQSAVGANNGNCCVKMRTMLPAFFFGICQDHRDNRK